MVLNVHVITYSFAFTSLISFLSRPHHHYPCKPYLKCSAENSEITPDRAKALSSTNPLQKVDLQNYHAHTRIECFVKANVRESHNTTELVRIVPWSFFPVQVYKSTRDNGARGVPRVIYVDRHIVVWDKPSGVLSVPGPNRKKSLAGYSYIRYGHEDDLEVDKTVVHRLDMDTSGIVIYARNDQALKALHGDFRASSKRVSKIYEALVCGHVKSHEGEIDIPLQRDHISPPFMRVSTEWSERERKLMLDEAHEGRWMHDGFKKMMNKKPKSSLTFYRVVCRENYCGLPVTRLILQPITGRTHQLRVHCAAIGHPILADSIYGYNGDGSHNGGLTEVLPSASLDLQAKIKKATDKNGCQLALHAKELSIYHPLTSAPIIFQSDAPF